MRRWSKLFGQKQDDGFAGEVPVDAGSAGRPSLDEVMAWLLANVAELAPSEDLARTEPLKDLLYARSLGAAFGMVLTPRQTELARQRVLPALDAQIRRWRDELRGRHGHPGQALYAETVQDTGIPLAQLPFELRPEVAPRPEGERRGTLTPLPGGLAREELEDGALTLDRREGVVVRARIHVDGEGSADPVALLEGVASQHGAHLEELTLGLWVRPLEGLMQTDYGGLDEAISAERFPALRELFVGDFAFGDETEISWTTVGAIDGYLDGLPALRALRVCGGGIELRRAHHERLRTLALETGGLPAATARAVARGSLPQLEELILWFGAADYGGDTTPADFEPFFTNPSFGRLRRLTLGNAEISDELAARIVRSPLAAQLEELSLELGTLSNAGAAALANGAHAFARLEQLRTGENFIAAEGRAALERAFGSRLVLGPQDQPDWWNGAIRRYVSVGE